MRFDQLASVEPVGTTAVPSRNRGVPGEAASGDPGERLDPRIRDLFKPIAKDHTNEDVFVDDDHERDRRRSLGIVGVVSAEDRILLYDGVESGLELVGEVACCDAPHELSVAIGHLRIPGAASPTSFFEEADIGHGSILHHGCASSACWRPKAMAVDRYN